MLDKTGTLTPPSPTMTRPASAVPRHLQRYLNLDDFEPTAKRILPKFLYGYVSGGAENDAAVVRERRAGEFALIELRDARLSPEACCV